jgi:hypothetical protein
VPAHRYDAGRGIPEGRLGVTDPVATAQAVMARAEALLVEVRQARIDLAAAAESPERAVYLGMLESFERGLLAALDEDVVAELKTLRSDPEAQRWLRRRLDGLEKEGHYGPTA